MNFLSRRRVFFRKKTNFLPQRRVFLRKKLIFCLSAGCFCVKN